MAVDPYQEFFNKNWEHLIPILAKMPNVKPAAFYEKEAFIPSAGKAITALGALLAAATVGAIYFHVSPLYGTHITILVGVAGAGGSIVLIRFGVRLRQRTEFWADPVFVRRVQLSMILCLAKYGYDESIKSFPSLLLDERYIRKDDIRWVLHDFHFRSGEHGYLNRLRNDPKNPLNLLIQHEIITSLELQDFARAELESQDILGFTGKHGWDVLKDARIVSVDDLKNACNKLKEKFNTSTFTEILGSLSEQDLEAINRLELLDKSFFQDKWKKHASLEETFSAAENRLKPKHSIWTLSRLGMISIEGLKILAINELKVLGVEGVLERHGWTFFENGFISANDPGVREKYLNYFKEKSFEALIECDLWQMFKFGLLSIDEAKDPFLQYLRKEDLVFTDFAEHFYEKAINCGLLSESVISDQYDFRYIKLSYLRYQNAESDYAPGSYKILGSRFEFINKEWSNYLKRRKDLEEEVRKSEDRIEKAKAQIKEAEDKLKSDIPESKLQKRRAETLVKMSNSEINRNLSHIKWSRQVFEAAYFGKSLTLN